MIAFIIGFIVGGLFGITIAAVIAISREDKENDNR